MAYPLFIWENSGNENFQIMNSQSLRCCQLMLITKKCVTRMASCSKPSITKYEKMIHEHCEVLLPCAVFTAHTRSLLLAAEIFFKYTKSPTIV